MLLEDTSPCGPPLPSLTSCQSWLPQSNHRAACVILSNPQAWKQTDVASSQSRALETTLLARKGVKATPPQHS